MVFGRPRARPRMLSPSSMPHSWTPWRIQRCASGSPRWVRKSGRATNKRQRRSPRSRRPKSRSGGRSSRLRASKRSKLSEGDIMKLPLRNFLHLAAGAAALPAVSRVARAQGYPTRPVRIIASTGPGGAPDILARLMGQWLSERLGQQFITENRPGGGGNFGTEAVVRAPPDGYTLLMVSSTNAINAALYDKLNFNFIRDIAP